MYNGEGVEGGQLHYEGLLDALQDGQEEEDRVEAGQEDLEMNLVDIVFSQIFNLQQIVQKSRPILFLV